jgi:hypothetical protein
MPSPPRIVGVVQATPTVVTELSAEFETATVLGSEGTVAATISKAAESAEEPWTLEAL